MTKTSLQDFRVYILQDRLQFHKDYSEWREQFPQTKLKSQQLVGRIEGDEGSKGV